ncbi:MAG: glycosyltransferase family 4 protein [Nanoarchaeota archaeon]|nr:glycosyltransferase family 4 protein [Nanoarchaeota archaeon]MBU1103986.1 glycosyltransferase family 4 protein [Nanoarchaeota archaeon]
MKKIIILYDFLKELGGLERVMFFQANVLKKLYDVELLFSYVSEKEKERIGKEFAFNDFRKISQIGKSRNENVQFFSTLLFPGKLKQRKADLIISHSFMASRMVHVKKKNEKTKFIAMIHHPPNFLYERNLKWVNNSSRFFAYILGLFFGDILRRADRKSVRNADSVIANSNYTRKRIKEIYGINAEVIYPPISNKFVIIDERVAIKILKKFGIEKRFILMHGRMIKDKRPDLGVLAFSKIKNKDIDFIISGTIEEEKRIRELVNKFGIEKRVKIAGRVSEEQLLALYNAAECLIMPTPKEDFGMTTVEAIACGCPVIAWKDGAGPEEIITEDLNGLLARPYDIEDFKEKVEKSLARKWNKKKVSLSSRKFSEKEIEKQLLNLVDRF